VLFSGKNIATARLKTLRSVHGKAGKTTTRIFQVLLFYQTKSLPLKSSTTTAIAPLTPPNHPNQNPGTIQAPNQTNNPTQISNKQTK